MRNDPILFALSNEAASREPRFVVRIEFDVASPHITSHADITGVPGDVLYGLLKKPSAISQRIIPDEGRSEIGSFTFTLVDKASAFTDAMRSQLVDQNAGLRRRKVEFYVGYKGMDFADFQLFQTQIVSRCTYRAGVYEIRCSDITRELRKEIFRPVATTLRDTVTENASTIPVYDTSKFHMVAHGAAYSDAPSATVGYLRIEDEVIRYTGQTLDSFTGCTRGVLNTRAAAHAVDVGTAAERRTKVEEFIYLEGPGPQVALSILTGSLYGTANTLPDHWNLGIESGFVRTADFTGIGLDLWDPSDDTATLIFRWDGLKQQDGKQFVERQIYLLLGCYSPVYSDGAMGLRRMTAVISDASPVITLTERELIELSALEHEYTLLHNSFRIYWAWNPITGAYERDTGFLDAGSIDTHGEAPLLTYEFKGLHSQRATDSTIRTCLDSIRDRYSQPPQTLDASIFGSLNRIEIGDIARVRVPPSILRDFAGPSGDYNRSFEVQQKTYDALSGDVALSLFGSTARPAETPSEPDGEENALPDEWYTSSGASLDTEFTITANVAATGNYTLTGATTLTASGAIFYWDDDLTIPSGCNITIAQNVQLRIRGFLTLNGTINGVGGGHAGEVDDNDAPWDAPYTGTPGFLGHSRGWDGIRDRGQAPRTPHRYAVTLPAVFTRGSNDAFPALELAVVSGSLTGLPTDLRGTGGPPGGRIVAVGDSVTSVGGTGGDGGAGLAIVCRGMGFGVSASITLNGESTASGSVVSIGDVDYYPGAGGPGGPGALLILLDGNYISVPVITGKVICTTGGLVQSGNPMTAREAVLRSVPFVNSPEVPASPFCGYPDPAILGPYLVDPVAVPPSITMSALDMSNAAHRIQYIPMPLAANPNEDPAPPAPTGLVAGHVFGGNAASWTNPDLDSFDVIEVYASIDNDRTNAEKAGETRASSFLHSLPLGGLRYYWIRAKVNPVSGRPARFSEWEPVSSTAGESSNIETPGEVPDAPDDITATGIVNAIRFLWSLPAYARLAGQLEIYEGDTGDDFEDVASDDPVWAGYGMSAIVPKDDDDDHRYWLVLNRSGIRSDPSPVAGIVAAAASVTADLVAYATPPSISASATLGSNPRTVITPPVEVIASGGTAPYTYAWAWQSGGSGITIDFPTFNDTTFTATHNLDGTVLTGTVRCTVTDDASATTIVDVPVLINFPSVG